MALDTPFRWLFWIRQTKVTNAAEMTFQPVLRGKDQKLGQRMRPYGTFFSSAFDSLFPLFTIPSFSLLCLSIQPHMNAIISLEISIFCLCKMLHKISSSEWFGLFLTTFFCLLQHLICTLLSLNALILSTLPDVPLGFG